MKNKKIHLITSALPYVNNVPHLGNLLQVLSADVFARFSRQRGYETFYVCGTDEYGTATELKALDENMSCYDLCTKYFNIHKEIYSWFDVSFDHFGRTSCKNHIKITQDIYSSLEKNGYIEEGVVKQYYCPKCKMFLADRFIIGECPKCHGKAKGDQCDECGSLLDPDELIEPKCSRCHSTPEVVNSKHLFLNLPKGIKNLEKWFQKAKVDGDWSQNAVSITSSWIKNGLEKRCITRDLKWGIPVNKEGYENKVFYVWFDAPIAYISLTSEVRDDWKTLWQNPENVNLYQFIGKDNIPFHTVIFPSSLLATGEKWTLLHALSSTEYLTYEGGKFSKSEKRGVFGTDCKDTGIESDIWRFYLFYNRPEKADYNFSFEDFEKNINGELVGNFSNLVNRVLSFVAKNYSSVIPTHIYDEDALNIIKQAEDEIVDKLENVKERDALHLIMKLSDYGNKYFQDNEVWKLIKTDKDKTDSIMSVLCLLIKDLSILLYPYIPKKSKELLSFFSQSDVSLDNLMKKHKNNTTLVGVKHLFERLDHDRILFLKDKFKGEGANMNSETTEITSEQLFRESVTLKVSKIVKIERHPEGDKLYILTLDTKEESERIIVSSIVPYYKEEELLNHNIILVSNLKPANFRGVRSNGMLLAASDVNDDSHSTCEVLFADNMEVGTVLFPQSTTFTKSPEHYVKADKFFDFTLKTIDGVFCINDTPFVDEKGNTVKSKKYINGNVG